MCDIMCLTLLFIPFRCADTEDDVDFKNFLPPIILPATSPTEIALPSLPRELDEQQVAAEAFSYIDHSSDSDFRGHLVNYDMTNIMVRLRNHLSSYFSIEN